MGYCNRLESYLPSSCQGRCVLGHKLFPDFVSENFSHVREYLEDNEVAVVLLSRNESARQNSMCRRWGCNEKQLKALKPRVEAWRDEVRPFIREKMQASALNKSEAGAIALRYEHLYSNTSTTGDDVRRIYAALGLP